MNKYYKSQVEKALSSAGVSDIISLFNFGTQDQIKLFPSIGAGTARNIINGRLYSHIDELSAIRGVGPRLMGIINDYEKDAAEKKALIITDPEIRATAVDLLNRVIVPYELSKMSVSVEGSEIVVPTRYKRKVISLFYNLGLIK